MTRQNADDRQIVDILGAAGWTPANELRAGYPAMTVGMHYQNGAFDVAVSRWASLTPGEFLLEATPGHLPLGLTASEIVKRADQPIGQIYLVYQDKLEVTLQEIIEFAKRVQSSNINDAIRPVLAVAPRAYAQQIVAGRQGDAGELVPSTVDPATWYPKVR
jgi:hypothetical protein